MKHGTNMRRGARLAILLVGFGIALGEFRPIVAQESRPAPRSYVNKASVNLPINLDERARPQLKEVQLYVKDNLQGPWTLKDKVPATQSYFNFKAPQDGEYYFCVVTVDRMGRSVPANVGVEPPGLVVVFDTQAPKIDMQVLGATPEGQEVRCDIRDANPDAAKTRFFFQTRDQLWRPLEAMPGQTDLFCIPVQAAFTGLVRVTAVDQAGNMSTREVNIANPQGVAAMPPPTGQQGVGQQGIGQQGVCPQDVVAADAKSGKLPLVSTADGDKGPQLGSFSEPVAVVANKQNTPRQLPAALTANQSGPELRSPPEKTIVPVAHAEGKPQLSSKHQLVNSTHVFLEYQIEQTGASGVGRVEIWCTRDMGKSWQKLGEDAKRKSPAEIDLPGEGLFGFTMVVCNGRGFSAGPPAAGDAPDMWIEVDTTRPAAELTGTQVAEDGAFQITWRASDKNMAEEPIDLYFAASREGPWRPISKGLKNDGTYRWSPGPEAGAQAFLRMVVRDLAGNVAVSETLQPITLDDLSRPRGRLLGITTTSK